MSGSAQFGARAEVTPNMKVPEQCSCKDGQCPAIGPPKKPGKHQKGCICTDCQFGNNGLLRSAPAVPGQPKKKTPKHKNKLRPGRLKKGSREYEAEREIVFARTSGLCELRLHPQCSGIAQGTHHVKFRSRGGSDSEANQKASCNPCNGWVDEHPLEAHDLGFAKHFWEDEE